MAAGGSQDNASPRWWLLFSLGILYRRRDVVLFHEPGRGYACACTRGEVTRTSGSARLRTRSSRCLIRLPQLASASPASYFSSYPAVGVWGVGGGGGGAARSLNFRRRNVCLFEAALDNFRKLSRRSESPWFARVQHLRSVEELRALLFYSPTTFSSRPAPSWINVIFAFRPANQREDCWTASKGVIAALKCDRMWKCK